MTEPRPTGTPLARLVLFMVCLSIAGSFIAGAHYTMVDLPAQKSMQAPTNTGSCMDACHAEQINCRANCGPDRPLCLWGCNMLCDDWCGMKM